MEAGETFIVWDDDDTPAATITINRWAKPELWTEQERDEPALYAHKVTVDRADGGQGLERSLLVSGPHRATLGPRTTGPQRTATVTTGPPSTQLSRQTPHQPQVAATRPRSLTRKRTQAHQAAGRLLGWDGVEAH